MSNTEKSYIAKVKVTRIYDVAFMSPDAVQAKEDLETILEGSEQWHENDYTDNEEQVVSIEELHE